MKKIFIAIVFVVIVGIGMFLYGTRAPSAPSLPIDETASAISATENKTVYKIDSSESKASFSIDEVLRGKPFTAVGTTSEIAGEIAVAGDELEIGTITINARTFKTDSTQRDGAIARLILKSEEPANEFITFVPASVTKTGTGTYAAAGDLTISGVTKPATFTVTFVETEGAVSGAAAAKIKRSDYGLEIPNIPFVASVPDVFSISANIVARATSAQ